MSPSDGNLDGVLVVDKPQGPTSSFIVQRVRRLLAVDKIGHTGTLDPMATGVLPLCLGKATALAQLYVPGAIVGGTYRLKRLIGKGGMGYVFCAEHTHGREKR